MKKLRERSMSVEVNTINRQLKAMRLGDGDLVLLRVPDGDRQHMVKMSNVLAVAIARLGVRAIGIVTDQHVDAVIEQKIPDSFWKSAAGREVERLREALARATKPADALVTLQRQHAEELQRLREGFAAATLELQQQHQAAIKELKRSEQAKRRYAATKQPVVEDLHLLSVDELKQRYAQPCEFKGCRFWTKRVNSNHCRRHGVIMLMLENMAAAQPDDAER